MFSNWVGTIGKPPGGKLCSLQENIFQMGQDHNEENENRDFPGGAVVKSPPANAGDTGSSPGPGRSHMLWSN